MEKRKFEHADCEWFEIHNDIKKENNVIREKKILSDVSNFNECLIESSRSYPLHHSDWLNKTHTYCFIPYSS